MKYPLIRVAAKRFRHHTFLFAAILLSIIVFSQDAWAGTFRWSAGSVTSTWNNSANWSLQGGTGADYGANGYPDGTDVADFQANVTVTVTGTIGCQDLNVSNNNASVTMGANATFTGSVTVNGTLIMAAGNNLNVTGTTTVNGTFTANSGNHSLTGAVTLSAATFNAGSGNIYFSNNLTITGGTFNYQTSTLEFKGAAQTITANTNINFYNITHSGTGTLNFTGSGASRTFTVYGTFLKNRATSTSLTSATLAYDQASGLSKLYYLLAASNMTVTSEFPTTNGPSNLEINDNGGTVTLTNSNYTITNNLTLTAGTLAAGNAANTVFVGGTLSTGTLTTTGQFTVGTIEMNGASAQTQAIVGGGGTATSTVFKLRMNRPLATDVILLSSGILKITGTLDITQGILAISSSANQLDITNATFTIRASGTFKTGGKTITATGATLDFKSGSTFEFDGTSTESFPATGASGFTYGNVVINNLADVNVPSGITIEIANNLNLAIDNGLLITGATNSKGNLQVDGSVLNASSVRYVKGPLRVPYSGTGSKTFAVGYNTNYLPAAFDYKTFSSGGGNSIIEVEVKGGDPTGSLPTGISAISTDHYYVVKEVGTAPSSFTYAYTGTWTGSGYSQLRNALLVQTGTGPITYSYPTPQSTTLTQVTTPTISAMPTNAGIIAIGSASGNVWTGATDTDWVNPTNWTFGLPSSSDDVTIDGAVASNRQPIIVNGTNAVAKTITVTGTSLKPGSLTLGTGGITPTLVIYSLANSLNIGANTTLIVNSTNTSPITFNSSGFNLGYLSVATVFNGTVQYTASGSAVPDDQYTNLTLSGVTSTGTGVNVSGALDVSSASLASGTITLNGSSAQTVSATTNLYNLTVNNTSGGVSLSTAVTLGGTLTLTNGIVTPSSTLTVAGTSGGSTSSYVNGALTISGTGSKTFPIGSGGYFRPVAVTGTNATTTFQLVNGNPGGTAVSPLTRISTVRYWIGNGGIQTSTSIQLSYDPVSDGVNSYSTIDVASSTSQNGSYYDRGGTTGTLGNKDTPWVGLYSTNQSTLSFAGTNPEYFVLSTTSLIDNPLPVELTKFSVAPDGKGVVLNWTTATETNNLGFIVSRSESKDGPFLQIASYQSNANLKGKGTTATESNYKLGDYSAALQPGKTYFYRLEDVNLTGQRNVLETKEVNLPNEYNLSQNYPNPFNPSTTINFALKQDGKALLEVYNILGQKVATLVNGQLKSGAYSYNWNAAGQTSGVYFYRLASGNFVQTKKMLLVK